MFGVKFLAHGSDAASRDGLLAARAQRAAALVVMHLTVGLPVVLEEAAVDEWCETFLQEEKAEGDRFSNELGMQAAHRPQLCGTNRPHRRQCELLPFIILPCTEPNSCLLRRASEERLRDGQVQPQARETAMASAGFPHTKEIKPATRQEEERSFPWDRKHGSTFLSFYLLISAQLPHSGNQGTGTNKVFLQQNVMNLGLVLKDKKERFQKQSLQHSWHYRYALHRIRIPFTEHSSRRAQRRSQISRIQPRHQPLSHKESSAGPQHKQEPSKQHAEPQAAEHSQHHGQTPFAYSKSKTYLVQTISPINSLLPQQQGVFSALAKWARESCFVSWKTSELAPLKQAVRQQGEGKQNCMKAAQCWHKKPGPAWPHAASTAIFWLHSPCATAGARQQWTGSAVP